MINFKNPIVRGSLVLLILTGFFNVLNFLYHLLMAHTLSIEDFGLLKRVFFFFYLGAVLMESIQTVVTKYSSRESKNNSKLKSLRVRAFKKIGKLSIFVFILFIFLSWPIGYFFNIPISLLFMTAAFLAGSMLVPITRGILQGQQRFYALGFSVISEGIFKVFISLFFVLLGWRVYGAIGGVLLSVILTLGVSLFYLKDIVKSPQKDIDLKGIRGYGWPVLSITATLILFFNLDVLISGSVFDETLSGMYAIASTVAITIFIGLQPINRVLFPITASETEKKIDTKRNFKKALSLILALSALALFIIYSFPDLLIKIISGKVIPEIHLPMFLLALGTAILSVSSLILYYKLSQGKTSGYLTIPLFLLIEVILLITLGHSLLSYSLAFLASNIIFLIGSLVLLNK